MMTAKTAHHSTRKALNEALEDAYDAQLNAHVSLFYDQIEIRWQLRYVDPALVDDAEYFQQIIALFHQVLHAPRWDETLCAQEKNFLLDDIKTKESQKSYLASAMLTDTLLIGHPYYLPVKEEAAAINDVGLEDVKALYQTMMVAARVISATGPLTPPALEAWIKGLKLAKHQRFCLRPIIKDSIPPKKALHVPVAMHQTYRYLVLSTRIFRDDAAYPIFQVFQHLLGGDSESLLFKRIRETHSMAYSVHATASIKYGLLIIQGAIDPSKIALFDEEVAAILEDIKTHGVDAKTLDLAKQSLQDRLQRNSDSASVLTQRALMHYYFNDPFSIGQALKDITKVTAADIQTLATQLTPVYAFAYGGSDAA